MKKYIVKDIENDIVLEIEELDITGWCETRGINKYKLFQTDPEYKGVDKRNHTRNFCIICVQDSANIPIPVLPEVVVSKSATSRNCKSKKVYKALLLGDIHFGYPSEESLSIFTQLAVDLKDEIDEVVYFGDCVDNSALSGYPNFEEDRYTLAEELEMFDRHLYDIKAILPAAKFSLLEDNHYDGRYNKFVALHPGLRGSIKEQRFMFDVVAKHGKPYYPLCQFGQDKIGAIHGIDFSDVFTKKLTLNYATDMIQGHTHVHQMYAGNNKLRGYGLPAMCRVDMGYLNGRPCRWTNGFAVLSWYPEEKVYSLEYVIVEGGVAVYRDKVYKGEKNGG